jgi:flagellar basal body rod protein FlgB
MARFAQNSVAFEASFSFLSSRFRTLASAIRGD